MAGFYAVVPKRLLLHPTTLQRNTTLPISLMTRSLFGRMPLKSPARSLTAPLPKKRVNASVRPLLPRTVGSRVQEEELCPTLAMILLVLKVQDISQVL